MNKEEDSVHLKINKKEEKSQKFANKKPIHSDI